MLTRFELPFLGTIASHDLLVGLAIVICVGLGLRWTIVCEQLPPGRVLIAIFLMMVIVLAGGRLHFAITKWHFFAADPTKLFRLSSGGLHAPGAIACLTIGGWFVLRALRLPIGRFVDGLAPTVGIGIALARFGCFLNGCCYGEICDLPWGISLPSDSYTYHSQIEAGVLDRGAPHSHPVHPLPLYFAGVGLLISAILLWRRPHRRYEGELGVILLFLFSASSTILEFWRAEHAYRIYWGPLPQLFWVSLAMTVAAGILGFRLNCSALDESNDHLGDRRDPPPGPAGLNSPEAQK